MTEQCCSYSCSAVLYICTGMSHTFFSSLLPPPCRSLKVAASGTWYWVSLILVYTVTGSCLSFQKSQLWASGWCSGRGNVNRCRYRLPFCLVAWGIETVSVLKQQRMYAHCSVTSRHFCTNKSAKQHQSWNSKMLTHLGKTYAEEFKG